MRLLNIMLVTFMLFVFTEMQAIRLWFLSRLSCYLVLYALEQYLVCPLLLFLVLSMIILLQAPSKLVMQKSHGLEWATFLFCNNLWCLVKFVGIHETLRWHDHKLLTWPSFCYSRFKFSQVQIYPFLIALGHANQSFTILC